MKKSAQDINAAVIKDLLDAPTRGECKQKMIDWCESKKSPYFTKADVRRITGVADDAATAYLEAWELTSAADHEKGSRWYRFRNHVMKQTQVADKVNDYLRLQMREDSFIRKIMPAMGVPKHMMGGPGQ